MAARRPLDASRLACVLAVVVGCGGDDARALEDGSAADADFLDATAPDDAGRPRDGGRAGGDAGVGLDAGPRLGPPYPIVLAHGFFGFEDFAGAGFLTYFHGVQAALAAEGETLVFTTEVDPFNDSTTRGAELLAHVEAILATTGHEKVNLVGHSQGGLDARVVAYERPELVASVTTIATPHRGSRISDVILGLVSDPMLRDLVDALVRVIGAPLYDAVGMETSVVRALEQFTTEGAAAFNAAYPDRITVDYYSVTGASDRNWGPACEVASSPDFVARWSSERDPIDPLLAVPEAVLDGGLGDPFPNDGLVRVVDARWGTFLGCIPADHLDEVGQLLGDRPGIGNDFDHLAFYVELVRWLRGEGH